jgi:ABC-type transporter Mla subunit MlaD
MSVDAYERFARGVWMAAGILALVAVAGIVAIEADVHLALRDLPATVADVHRAIVVAGGAAGDLEKTLRTERQASADQLKAAAAGQAKLNRLLDNAADFLAGLGETNRDLATLIENQDLALHALEAQATADLADLGASEKQLTAATAEIDRASTSAAELLADPHLTDSLAELDRAMAKTNDTLAHLSSIAASGDRDAAMLEARLRQALKPASLAKSIFLRAVGIAGPAAQIATAAK